jgi:Ca2+-binding RTX toxin-like protein
MAKDAKDVKDEGETPSVTAKCGTDGDDTLVAGDGGAILSGSGGNDVIVGGPGDDLLIGGSGSDTIDGGPGNDTIYGDGPDCGEIQGIRITFKGEDAGFRNTLGVYTIDPVTGAISNVQLAFADTTSPPLAVGTTFDYVAPEGSHVGVFLIGNGASLNDFSSFGPGRFAFLNADGSPATVSSINPQLVHIAPDGTQTPVEGPAYHSAGFGPNAGLNADGLLHTQGISENPDGSVTLGFEDLPNLGDMDFDDTIFKFQIGGTNVSFANAHFDPQPTPLSGVPGNDSLIGGEGDDLIFGGAGDDTIFGGEGDDSLFGGEGDDQLFGGDGQDQLFGGAGDDTLAGGAGDDTLDGGDDRDTFVIDSTLGVSRVFGGAGGDDFDRLDLSAIPRTSWRLASSTPDSDGNGIDGVIELLDGNGAVTGRVIFENIEQIVPCFTPGTLIATPRGERPIEDLRVGDKVLTRDNGIQEIRWVGRKDLDARDLSLNPHLRPVLIRQGSLGAGLPERDMLVSPNHRVLVANDRTALYFDEHEVLVAAKHLLAGNDIAQVAMAGTSYIHILFDRHEVVLSNGAWTESFQPGDYTLGGMGNAQRSEIFELFPELRTTTGQKSYGAARRTLKGFEARLITR